MKTLTVKAVLSLFGVFVSVAAWADIAAVVDNCNGCHGDDGVSQWTDVPTIAGIDAFVHSEALYIYKDEARPCAVSEYRQGGIASAATSMCEVAGQLNDEMIEAIAEYYSEIPFTAAQQEFDAVLAGVGEDIHNDNCGLCHSDGGSNPDDEASILAGQWMGYLQATFAQYRAGEREQPPTMQRKLDALSDEDVTALLHYYASQQ